ncbi:hypothetical protein cyc_06825 [Cyclospora cayetanensis]|nr:hypothetical protein cyc_06825 [Cyclospora cayetanensis]
MPSTTGTAERTAGQTSGGSSSSRAQNSSSTTSPSEGPFRDSNTGRGSSSFRSSGGGAATSPLEQGGSDNTTYYLREADGSLTPIEPPPYDQMKPDSYYTDLYLTDQPIRFENHHTKTQQFKFELEKAHETNIQKEQEQPTQGVIKLPIAEEKKGVM